MKRASLARPLLAGRLSAPVETASSPAARSVLVVVLVLESGRARNRPKNGELPLVLPRPGGTE